MAAVLLMVGNLAEPFTLMAIGDWGGDNDWSPSNKAEKAAAAGMATVAKDLNANGSLLLGDNFYRHGVRSNESSRFQSTFEAVYTQALFPDLPFYVIWSGWPRTIGRREAQVGDAERLLEPDLRRHRADHPLLG